MDFQKSVKLAPKRVEKMDSKVVNWQNVRRFQSQIWNISTQYAGKNRWKCWPEHETFPVFEVKGNIRLETKSCRTLSLNYATKYDLT